MKFVLLIFICAAYLNSVFPYEEQARIVSRKAPGVHIIGGNIARASQFPYVAAIYSTTETGTFFCAGALINNQWILTAAQCINGAIRFNINLGSNNLEGDDPHRVLLATATSVVHPGFNPETLENDVGLIRLRLPIDFNEYISAINLPVIPLTDYSTVTAIGWGQDSDQNPGLVNSLQFVELATIANSECKIYYGNQINNNMVCVIGEYNEGTCTGDSGGPLIEYRSERAAVHAAISTFFSSNGCESTNPSGYTRTYPYVEWIKNVTML